MPPLSRIICCQLVWFIIKKKKKLVWFMPREKNCLIWMWRILFFFPTCQKALKMWMCECTTYRYSAAKVYVFVDYIILILFFFLMKIYLFIDSEDQLFNLILWKDYLFSVRLSRISYFFYLKQFFWLGSYFSCVDICFDKMHFFCNWVDLKMCLEYHEVYWVIKISDIIEYIKIELRNKLRKSEIVNFDTSLDTSSTLASIEIKRRTSTLAQHRSIYQATQIQNIQIRILARDN